ncbi:MAG: helix-turn-helix domain-containing protein [Terriglobia bacterium]
MSAILAPAIDAKRYGRLLSRALPRVIRTEEENERLIQELAKLDERDLSLEEEELAELLAALIEEYEDKRYPIGPVSPHAMLQHLMESRSLTHKDVWRLLGSKGVASEVLNGKRSISKAQAKKLAEFFHVTPDLFI